MLVFLRSAGRLFQVCRAAYEKRLFPYVFVLIFGTTNVLFVDDRRFRMSVYGCNSSVMYCGASPFKDLIQVGRAWMQYVCRIGNQCSCSKAGVMWFLRGQPETNGDAEFWTRCNLSKRLDGKPQYKALLLSSREMISAWMTVFRESLVSLFFMRPMPRRWK